MLPKNNDLMYKTERNKFNKNPDSDKYVIVNDVAFFAHTVRLDNHHKAFIFYTGKYGDRIKIKIENIGSLKVYEPI